MCRLCGGCGCHSIGQYSENCSFGRLFRFNLFARMTDKWNFIYSYKFEFPTPEDKPSAPIISFRFVFRINFWALAICRNFVIYCSDFFSIVLHYYYLKGYVCSFLLAVMLHLDIQAGLRYLKIWTLELTLTADWRVSDLLKFSWGVIMVLIYLWIRTEFRIMWDLFL